MKAAVSLDDLEQLSKDIIKYEAEIQRFELLELRKLANEQFILIRALLGAYDDHLKEEQRERILNWISTVDYRSHHLDIHNRLLQGTTEWLFEKPEFVQWMHSPVSSLLWLRGDGKLNSIHLSKLRQLTLLQSRHRERHSCILCREQAGKRTPA